MVSRSTVFRLSQGVYYLALGTWFGAVVMLAVAAAATFATVRGAELSADAWADVVMADRNRLAGAVVGQALRGLAVIQLICATLAVVATAVQWTMFRDRLVHAGRSRPNGLRIVLLLGAVIVLAVNLGWITPNVREAVQTRDDPAVTAAEREQAEHTFAHYHRLSERSTGASALLLAVAVLVSPFAFRSVPVTGVMERPVRSDAPSSQA